MRNGVDENGLNVLGNNVIAALNVRDGLRHCRDGERCARTGSAQNERMVSRRADQRNGVIDDLFLHVHAGRLLLHGDELLTPDDLPHLLKRIAALAVQDHVPFIRRSRIADRHTDGKAVHL